MTPLEQQAFANMVADAIAAKQDKEQDFWIGGEKHYQDHIKFCGWITFFEKCKEEALGFLRKSFIRGGIVIIAAVISTGIYFAATFNGG